MEHVAKPNDNLQIKKRYTIGEELFNAISHGIGAIFAVAATTLMVAASALQLDWAKLGASIIYGLSLVMLYLMSTLYHALRSPKVKGVLRVFDHCSIFLLIAGTYTPYTLITLKGRTGYLLFAFVWGAAIVGIILNIISIERFKRFSMICYLAMGWSVVWAFSPIMAALPRPGLLLLLWGGIAYTGGVVFYAVKKPYFHGIWHLFVLAGSVLHFISIFRYVIL